MEETKKNTGTEENGQTDRRGPQTADLAYQNLEDTYETQRQIEENETNPNEKIPEERTIDEQETKKQESKVGEDLKKKTGDEREKSNLETEREEQAALLERLRKQQEAQRKKTEDRVTMNLGRENSTDETLQQWIYRTMKVNPQRVDRVRKGNHEYAYEIIDQNGKNVGEELLTPRIGGTNPRMKIWTLDPKTGHYVEKEFDSFVTTKNGRYGLATDRGNGSIGDIPKSYQVTRLPGGEYIAVQALEQQKRNREASGIDAVKNATASKNSDHEMKEEIEAAKEAKTIDAVKEDGEIDTKEVEIVELLRREGFKQEEIDKIFEDIYKGVVKEGMTAGQVEQTAVAVKDLQAQGCRMDQIREILARNNGQIPEDLGDDKEVRTMGGDALERRENRH